MRIIDADEQRAVHTAQVYVTPEEALILKSRLGRLLRDPEAPEHFHIVDIDQGQDLSISIVTPAKLASGGYTPLEQQVLSVSKQRM